MIERFWTEKMASLPGDILERLEFPPTLSRDCSLRCFLAGFGWERFLAELTKYLPRRPAEGAACGEPRPQGREARPWRQAGLNGSNTTLRSIQPSQPKRLLRRSRPLRNTSSKIFISPPNTQSDPNIDDEIKTAWGNNLFILSAQSEGTDEASNFEAQLGTFPDNTFDLIIFLWLLSPTQPDEMLKRVHRALKPKAQFALVTPFDGSPRLVFSILKQILKQDTSTRLKLYPSNLPANTRQLRKLLYRTGFKEVRIWPDAVKCDYPDGQSVFSDLLKLSPGNLFREPVKAENKRFIQERFIELIEKRRCLSEPTVITVNFDFGCATGFK